VIRSSIAFFWVLHFIGPLECSRLLRVADPRSNPVAFIVWQWDEHGKTDLEIGAPEELETCYPTNASTYAKQRRDDRPAGPIIDQKARNPARTTNFLSQKLRFHVGDVIFVPKKAWFG
jgi:hypothetical protein